VIGQLHAPAALFPGERAPGTHWIGGLVGARAGLDALSKRKFPSLHRDLKPDHPIVQPVVSRYAWLLIISKKYQDSIQ